MISCPRDVFRDALGYSVIAKAGGKKVQQQASRLKGNVRDGGHSLAEVLEYATPGGEVIARMVKACDAVECWLRSDLATETLIARADAEAEIERIKREMAAYCHASKQHARDQRADEYVLSSALIHASARHQSRIGRLWDMNARGDAVRGNLAAALGRAVKAEAGK